MRAPTSPAQTKNTTHMLLMQTRASGTNSGSRRQICFVNMLLLATQRYWWGEHAPVDRQRSLPGAPLSRRTGRRRRRARRSAFRAATSARAPTGASRSCKPVAHTSQTPSATAQQTARCLKVGHYAKCFDSKIYGGNGVHSSVLYG